MFDIISIDEPISSVSIPDNPFLINYVSSTIDTKTILRSLPSIVIVDPVQNDYINQMRPYGQSNTQFIFVTNNIIDTTNFLNSITLKPNEPVNLVLQALISSKQNFQILEEQDEQEYQRFIEQSSIDFSEIAEKQEILQPTQDYYSRTLFFGRKLIQRALKFDPIIQQEEIEHALTVFAPIWKHHMYHDIVPVPANHGLSVTKATYVVELINGLKNS